MKILLGAVISLHPFSPGNAWNRLHYALGFRDLGHDVYFLEEVEPRACVDRHGRPCRFEESVNRAVLPHGHGRVRLHGEGVPDLQPRRGDVRPVAGGGGGPGPGGRPAPQHLGTRPDPRRPGERPVTGLPGPGPGLHPALARRVRQGVQLHRPRRLLHGRAEHRHPARGHPRLRDPVAPHPPPGRARPLAGPRRPHRRQVHDGRLAGPLQRPELPRGVVPVEVRGVAALRRPAAADRPGDGGGPEGLLRGRPGPPPAPGRWLVALRRRPHRRPVGPPGVHRRLARGDRHRQARLRARPLGLVQRPLGGVPGQRQARADAGDRVRAPPARGPRAGDVRRRGRGRRRGREHQPRLRRALPGGPRPGRGVPRPPEGVAGDAGGMFLGRGLERRGGRDDHRHCRHARHLAVAGVRRLDVGTAPVPAGPASAGGGRLLGGPPGPSRPAPAPPQPGLPGGAVRPHGPGLRARGPLLHRVQRRREVLWDGRRASSGTWSERPTCC